MIIKFKINNNKYYYFKIKKYINNLYSNKRTFSCTSTLKLSDNKPSLINRILRGDQYDHPTNAHSVLLANPEILYEYQVHDVKPHRTNDYQKLYCDYIPKLLIKYPDLRLTGAWSSEIGVLDRYIHIWRYDSYLNYQKMFDALREDKEHTEFLNETKHMIKRRESQICLGFSYWGEPIARDTKHIYELRSYSLKPGTLIEWGNNWARGIRTRFDSRVVGMFTQVGSLYYVHHMWAYKNLQDRKEKRESAWSKPGWDECVSYTVPLIRKMDSKILISMQYSPLK